jgi:hypothetical protein
MWSIMFALEGPSLGWEPFLREPDKIEVSLGVQTAVFSSVLPLGIKPLEHIRQAVCIE